MTKFIRLGCPTSFWPGQKELHETFCYPGSFYRKFPIDPWRTILFWFGSARKRWIVWLEYYPTPAISRVTRNYRRIREPEPIIIGFPYPAIVLPDMIRIKPSYHSSLRELSSWSIWLFEFLLVQCMAVKSAHPNGVIIVDLNNGPGLKGKMPYFIPQIVGFVA